MVKQYTRFMWLFCMQQGGLGRESSLELCFKFYGAGRVLFSRGYPARPIGGPISSSSPILHPRSGASTHGSVLRFRNLLPSGYHTIRCYITQPDYKSGELRELGTIRVVQLWIKRCAGELSINASTALQLQDEHSIHFITGLEYEAIQVLLILTLVILNPQCWIDPYCCLFIVMEYISSMPSLHLSHLAALYLRTVVPLYLCTFVPCLFVPKPHQQAQSSKPTSESSKHSIKYKPF